MFEWLDKIIEEQKHNTEIMEQVCSSNPAAELQEMKEQGEI